jgi:asparagine synthetase B (glutamine-hydrolysing)
MAVLDVGFPLLDDRLVDFSLRLPEHYKLRGLKLRWFFKEALRGFLPEEIITKKKHGFGLPFRPWAVKGAALNALATDSLRGVAARGLVRAEFVDGLLTPAAVPASGLLRRDGVDPDDARASGCGRTLPTGGMSSRTGVFAGNPMQRTCERFACG